MKNIKPKYLKQIQNIQKFNSNFINLYNFDGNCDNSQNISKAIRLINCLDMDPFYGLIFFFFFNLRWWSNKRQY